MAFLIKRGKPAIKKRRHAHLARYDAHGRIAGAWCPAAGFDMSSNVPWGLAVCKHCIRRSRA